MVSPPEEPLKAYRIADTRHPLWDGGGAALYGGRWSSPGRRIIYAALTFAGAMLEVLVHTNTGRIPRHHGYIQITIPRKIGIERVDIKQLPGWDDPSYSISRGFGDQWHAERRSAVLIVPSVVSRLECNVLINQDHSGFKLIRASKPQPVRWDQRLFPNHPS